MTEKDREGQEVRGNDRKQRKMKKITENINNVSSQQPKTSENDK